MDGVLLNLVLALHGDDGGVRALGDDGDAGALGVLLGQVGEGLGDGGDVLRNAGEVVGLGVGGGLGLVADYVVPVGRRGVQRVLEELSDERRRQVHHEHLVLGGGLFAQRHDSRRADGEVETADVEEVGVLGELPDLGALEVVDVVEVGSAELGAEGAVDAGDDGAAAAGGGLGVDAVLDAQADLLDGVAQDGGVLVVADAAEVHDAVGRQDVLGAAGRVLRRTARDQLRIVVIQQLLVQREVLLLGQDRVVRLQVILLQEILSADGLDVQEGILQAQERKLFGGSHIEGGSGGLGDGIERDEVG